MKHRKRRFCFSWKVSLICGLLALLMLRASYWQWERHLEKEQYVALLQERLELPPVPLEQIISGATENPESFRHRRVLLSGVWDFEKEVVLRNRKHDVDGVGVHVLTPLQLDFTERRILVNRGYIPLPYQQKDARTQFQSASEQQFVGLIKLTEEPKLLAPSDPPAGPDFEWRDAWLRVDTQSIAQQLPYSILPFYVEQMTDNQSNTETQKEIVRESSSRAEIFYFDDADSRVKTGELRSGIHYPIPSHTTTVPSATHFAYVFEWAAMAFVTLAIGFLLQWRGVTKK